MADRGRNRPVKFVHFVANITNFSEDANHIRVKDLREKNSDGTDQLWDIEALKFDDQTYYVNGEFNKSCPTTWVPRVCGSANKNYFKKHSDKKITFLNCQIQSYQKI